jgi:hypothetical protein
VSHRKYLDCHRKPTLKARNIFFSSYPSSSQLYPFGLPHLHDARGSAATAPASIRSRLSGAPPSGADRSRAGASWGPPIGADRSRAGVSQGLHSVPPRAGQGCCRRVLPLSPVGACQGRRRASIQRRQEQRRAVAGAFIRPPPRSR